MQINYIAKLFLCVLFIGCPLFSQTTVKLSTIQKYNPLRVEGGVFEHRLFQADALLRLGDAVTTHRTVFDGTGHFIEADPIAPGQNHPVWMAYGFQLGAHVAVVQGHNFLVRRHHAKIARALVIADIAVEAYTVGMNAHHETMGTPPIPAQSTPGYR